MTTNSPQRLEELIQRELSKLPERTAPASLIPAVLARIQAREQRSWWQQPWSYWPSSLKAVSLPFLLALAGSGVFGASLAWNLVRAEADFSEVSDTLGSLSAVWDAVAALGNAVLVLGRAGEQWLMLALLSAFAMYLACIGLGTLCYRMAFYKR